MSAFDIIQAAIIFGSGVIFAAPAGALFMYASVQDKVQREELLRHTREQHERNTLNSLKRASRTLIPVGVEKVPVAQQRVVPVLPGKLINKVDIPACTLTPIPTRQPMSTMTKFDFTRVEHLPTATDRRHALPTRSPLVSVTLSLKTGSEGWAVTGRRGVTETDMMSLKAIANAGTSGE